MGVVITSWPETSAAPAMRPPWKCGTRPLRTRSRVDLPPPDDPVTRVRPASTSTPTSRSAGSSAPGYQYERLVKRAIAMSRPERKGGGTRRRTRYRWAGSERRIGVPVSRSSGGAGGQHGDHRRRRCSHQDPIGHSQRRRLQRRPRSGAEPSRLHRFSELDRSFDAGEHDRHDDLRPGARAARTPAAKTLRLADLHERSADRRHQVQRSGNRSAGSGKRRRERVHHVVRCQHQREGSRRHDGRRDGEAARHTG